MPVKHEKCDNSYLGMGQECFEDCCAGCQWNSGEELLSLELELVIAAWDNYKKNGFDKAEDGLNETEEIIDDNLMKLIDEERRGA